MSQDFTERGLVTLSSRHPVWNRVHLPSTLVVVGTREPDGGWDLAPKHMVAPMGWGNFFGFVCTPRHATYVNARREGAFTVSFPRPDQVLVASLASAPRCETSEKPSMELLETFPASEVDGVLVTGARMYLECELYRVYDDFDENSLITGRIVTAHVREAAIRRSDRDDRELLQRAPVLVYLSPGRWAAVGETHAFPFHRGWSR